MPQVSRIPSIPFSKADPHSRITRWLSGLPTFTPRYTVGIKTHAANPGSTLRSLQQSSSRQDRVPSFSELRYGSRLPIRLGTITPPTAPLSLQPPSLAEERRVARQTQARPWITERSAAIPFALPARQPLTPRLREATATIPRREVCRPATPEPQGTDSSSSSSPTSTRSSVAKTVKKVLFACQRTVIPVTPWIDREQHVHDWARELDRKILAPHTFKAKHKAKKSGYNLFPLQRQPKKSVRFAETTEISIVTRWIDPQEDVHPDPIAAQGRKLQGWEAIPLSKPREDGHTEHYRAYVGTGPYGMLKRHCPKKPCGRKCSYGYLALVQASRPNWIPKQVFKAWLLKREQSRKQGSFYL